MKTIINRLAAVAALCLLPATADAAVTHIVKDGILMGAKGVTIGDKTYDVSFTDGTCASVFGSCETSKFDFDQYSYVTAMLALSDQVFIDTTSLTFDSKPALINGCGDAASCMVLVPVYRGFVGRADTMLAGSVYNHALEPKDMITTYQFTPSVDSSADNSATFARFTLAGPTSPEVTAVPEPATWALMLAGFGLTGAAMRRRRRSVGVAIVA